MLEKRYTKELRADQPTGEEEILRISGYAAIFNTEFELFDGFFESVDPGAFSDVLAGDIRCLFNHDPNQVLARTQNNTLRLSVDAKGLKYEADLPDTQMAKDLFVSISRGDITQSSLAFIVESDEVTRDADDVFHRRILKLKELFDVSPVTYPANPDTSVMKRFREKLDKPNLSVLRCQLLRESLV